MTSKCETRKKHNDRICLKQVKYKRQPLISTQSCRSWSIDW